MKKISLLLLIFVISSVSMMADDAVMTEVVKIDGTALNNFANKITFTGSDMVLNFEDNTSQTVDVSKVSIDFTYSAATAISNVESDNVSKDNKVYNLNGQYVGATTEGLSHGIYITKGKKITVK